MLGRGRFVQLMLFGPFVSLCFATSGQIPSFVEQGSVRETLIPMIFERQLEKNSRIRQFSVTVETCIRILKPAPYLLVFHPKQYHYVDRVALSQFEKFQKAAGRDRTGNPLWNLDRAAFAAQIFLGESGFTQDNYRVKFESTDQEKYPGSHVYWVDPIKKHQASGDDFYFRGRIWVAPNDYTIVHFAGQLVPASQLQFPLVELHNFEFESFWFEAQPGLWLPDKVITNNSGPNRDDLYPDFEAVTTFSNWKPL